MYQAMRDGECGAAPDAVTYSTLISISDRGRAWRRALSLLKAMRARGMQRDLISHNLTISALSKVVVGWRSGWGERWG